MPCPTEADTVNFLGSGEMSGFIQAFDWAATSLGPIESWSQSLRTAVSIVMLSPVPMVILWGTDGNMIYNDGYAVFAGNRHPGILGEKVRLAWPEATEFNDNVMNVCMAGGTLSYRDQELTLNRYGGPGQVWMALDYSPVLDDDGRPGGVIAVVNETTKRVLAERRLAVERNRLEALFKQAPSFIIVMGGPDHLIEFVNNTHRALFGSDDWTGKTIRTAFPDVADQGFFELMDIVFQSGQPFQARGAPVRYRQRPDGPEQVRLLDFIYAPILGESGQVTGVFCEGYDVTERERAVNALRTSEASLRELNTELERQVIERSEARGKTWQVTPDLLGSLNPQGFFESSNPAWKTVLGWSEEEVSSMSVFDFLHPDDVARTKLAFERTAQGEPVIRFPNRYRCKDGGYRWISWIGVPEGGIVYCSGRDVTEDILAQAELSDAQAALRQSQKMEAVGQLTGGIAHDFNNLLAGISGSLEMLEKRLSEGRLDDVRRYITGAQESARRAASLTQRLLAFSRRQTLDPTPTDLHQLVAGIEDLISRAVGPGIDVAVTSAPDLSIIEVDQPQLESALLNLCINARDAMPDGGRIDIGIAHQSLDLAAGKERGLPSGHYIVLSVTDTGTGMTEEVKDRAFDPFFTTKPLGQGTGLGLSMIHGFVRQSGGQASISSQVGKGTTVELYLPKSNRPISSLPPDNALATPDTGRGETILLVDDEALVRLMMVDIIEDAGYVVLQAGDGPSGLKILQSGARIDLLVTDVGLPGGMNGRQLADVARTSRPELPVLFVTGYAENAVVGNGHLDSGMHLLVKPFQITTLTARISEIIQSKSRVPPAVNR